MEKALLDGEKETEMEELQRDQERINILKERHREVVERAARERQKVRQGLTAGILLRLLYVHVLQSLYQNDFYTNI